jgi:hypothetical protein
MSLLKIAREKAAAERKAEEDKKEQESKLKIDLQNSLKEITAKVLDAMSEFGGVICKSGVLELNRRSVYDQLVTLHLISNIGLIDEVILYVHSAVVSGTWDASDDCRDIPYTEARVSIYSPEKRTDHNGHNYGYGTLQGHLSVNITSLDKVDDSLKKVAEYLSPLF